MADPPALLAALSPDSALARQVSHGFHNDTTPRYDAEAAELAWRRALEHFDRHP